MLALRWGRHTSLSFGWSLPAERSLSRPDGILGRSRAARPGLPASRSSFLGFFGSSEHQAPQPATSQHHRPEGSVLAAVCGTGALRRWCPPCLLNLTANWGLPALGFGTVSVPCCWECRRLRRCCERLCRLSGSDGYRNAVCDTNTSNWSRRNPSLEPTQLSCLRRAVQAQASTQICSWDPEHAGGCCCLLVP